MLCKTPLVKIGESWSLFDGLEKSKHPSCELSMGTTWQETVAASRSWEQSLANSQQEKGETHYYTHKELNFGNKLNRLQRGP